MQVKTGFAVTENPIFAASSCTYMRICVHIGMPLIIVHIKDCYDFGFILANITEPAVMPCSIIDVAPITHIAHVRSKNSNIKGRSPYVIRDFNGHPGSCGALKR